MPRKKSDANLMASVDKIEDFVLLLASGASPDCEIKGEPLVKHYYDKLERVILGQPIPYSEKYKPVLDKLKALISFGANVDSIFEMPIFTGNAPLFAMTVVTLENKFILVETILASEKAKQLIAQDQFYSESLSRIREQMERVTEELKKINI